MKKVSVVVPAYNCEAYVDACIGCLLAQTYSNLEIVAVNDGSKDHTLQALKRYQDRIIILDKPNGGVASARNAGLRQATGDFIMFLDSDDYLDTDAVFKLVEQAEKTGAEIVRFRILWEYPDGTQLDFSDISENSLFLNKKQFPHYIYKPMLTGITFNSAVSCMYQSKIAKQLSFLEDMATAEDAVFNVQAFTLAQSFLYLPNVYYHYTQLKTSLTGKGLPVLKKYQCNYRLSKLLAHSLKQWEMDTFQNRFLAYFRLIAITLSKLKREKAPAKSSLGSQK